MNLLAKLQIQKRTDHSRPWLCINVGQPNRFDFISLCSLSNKMIAHGFQLFANN